MTDLLDISDLCVAYRTGAPWRRQAAPVVDRVSLRVGQGEIVGLIGESGSGKSTIARAVVGLAPVSGGNIVIGGSADRTARARRVQMIFQDPAASLDPRMTIGAQIAEVLAMHRVAPGGVSRVIAPGSVSQVIASGSALRVIATEDASQNLRPDGATREVAPVGTTQDIARGGAAHSFARGRASQKTMRDGVSGGMSPRAARRARVLELLARVGLPGSAYDRLPHMFSGGQRARIGIARALAVEPALLIADEATAALDISVQAQILNLLLDLRDDLGLSIQFITHDLAVVRVLCDRAIVLRQGRVVEEGTPERLCQAPEHPYTRALFAAHTMMDAQT